MLGISKSMLKTLGLASFYRYLYTVKGNMKRIFKERLKSEKDVEM